MVLEPAVPLLHSAAGARQKKRLHTLPGEKQEASPDPIKLLNEGSRLPKVMLTRTSHREELSKQKKRDTPMRSSRDEPIGGTNGK